MQASTIVAGDQLGLYTTDPRYLREWLSAQAASGYVPYDVATPLFRLNVLCRFQSAMGRKKER